MRAIAELLRIALLPSAISNVLMAWWVTQLTWQTWAMLVVAMSVAAMFYCGGMALNDWHDRDQDRITKKQRPIVRGELSPRSALKIATTLLFGGCLTTVASVFLFSTPAHPFWPWPIFAASALVFAIWLYDGPAKRTSVAPWVMGSCRAGNVLLAACMAWVLCNTTQIDPSPIFWSSMFVPYRFAAIIWIAFSLGLYISGITWFARGEDKDGIGVAQWLGFFVTAAALGCYWWLTSPKISPNLSSGVTGGYQWMIVILGGWVLVRMGGAMAVGSVGRKRLAIVTGLRTMIMLDAAVCFLHCTTSVWPALMIAGLLPLSYALSRWSAVT